MPDTKDSAVTGVNTGAPAAATTGSSEAPREKTVEEILSEKDAQIAKLTGERDNYKKGLLIAKGKKDSGEEVDVAEVAKQAALAALAESDLGRILSEKEEIIKTTLKRNSELELALKNRPLQGTGTGSNQEVHQVKDTVLSEAQERQLRQERGWDDKKIEALKKNLTK